MFTKKCCIKWHSEVQVYVAAFYPNADHASEPGQWFRARAMVQGQGNGSGPGQWFRARAMVQGQGNGSGPGQWFGLELLHVQC